MTWQCDTYDGHWPPVTRKEAERRVTGISISGPDKDQEIEVEISSTDETATCWFHVAILANHLRQAGWTVTPPGAQS